MKLQIVVTDLGETIVHKARCADLNKAAKKPFHDLSEEFFADNREAATAEYNSDFDEETDGWYELTFMNCCKELPKSATTEAKKATNQKEKKMSTHTSGVFAVKFDNETIHIGSSSQIEVAYRDYMNWTVKGKAPRFIQQAFDWAKAKGKNTNEEAYSRFSYKVVIEADGKDALRSLRSEYKKYGAVSPAMRSIASISKGLTEELVVTKVVEEPVAMTANPSAERNTAILERLAEGEPASVIAKAFGVSKSTIYNIKRDAYNSK